MTPDLPPICYEFDAERCSQIPVRIKDQPQWVNWQARDRIDKRSGDIIGLDKIPIDPKTNPSRPAQINNSASWGAFRQCIDALPHLLNQWRQSDPQGYRGGGIGYVFTLEDGLAGIDLDKVREPSTGLIAPWARHVIRYLNSYTEISPTGTGVKIFCQASLPGGGVNKHYIELYDQGRFFTVTGWHLDETPATIEARPEEVHALYCVHAILDTALTRYGARFELLFAGEWEQACNQNDIPFPSQSEADQSFCNLAANVGASDEQIDTLMRMSGLYRDKWDTRHFGDGRTYGQATLANSLGSRDDGARLYIQKTAPTRQLLRSDQDLPWSDQTNAEMLVRLYGKDMRYCHPWKKWMTWNSICWEVDQTGAAMRHAKETIKRLAQEAATRIEHLHTLSVEEQEKTLQLVKHVKSSLFARRLQDLLILAASEAGIPILPADLDQHPMLLPCLNGTVDLTTGLCRPHQRGDLLTKHIPVVYDPAATCPQWEAFLWQIMGGSVPSEGLSESSEALEELQQANERAHRLTKFLQRVVGYALTGDVTEQALFILWGSGSNGKSTFLNTLMAMLGAYAIKAVPDLLMVKKNDTHPTERADLFGCRLVAAIETEKGRSLSEVLVKEMTGGDPIRARRMREDFWEFFPTHKVLLATNHKPVIRGTDHAIWRRIRLIPFTITIPDEKQDKGLMEKLSKEFPGILAWAIEGCLEWQREGLGLPDEVEAATEDYRSEMDVLGDFLETYCHQGPNYRIKVGELWKAYQRWCDETGESPGTQKQLGQQLQERGFVGDRGTNGTRWRLGLALRPHEGDANTGGMTL
jgi:putative DNA primase/helicase